MNVQMVGRGSLATALSMAALLAVTAPVGAAEMGMYRSSGRMATVDWLEPGSDDDALPGNVHIGSLYVDESSNNNVSVWGYIEDYQCDPGEEPYGGHATASAEHEEPGEGACDWVGERYLDNDGATFTMDRKMTQATLVGRLLVKNGGHGEPGSEVSVPVDIAWSAVGDSYSEKSRFTYSDGTTTYTSSYTFTGTDAVIDGTMGPMDFNDEEGDESYGSMGSYRSTDRYRSR